MEPILCTVVSYNASDVKIYNVLSILKPNALVVVVVNSAVVGLAPDCFKHRVTVI
jgi:hypothetical protein